MPDKQTTQPRIPMIDVSGDTLPEGREGYDAIVAAGAASLATDEYWVIDGPEGPLWDTASKRLDEPVLIFCCALECDWDEATESGFRLARLRKDTSHD